MTELQPHNALLDVVSRKASGDASSPIRSRISVKPDTRHTCVSPPAAASAEDPTVFHPASAPSYDPDPHAVASKIVEYLLSDKAAQVCDAIVQTSDNARIPVCSCLLSIRSSYMKELFGKAERGGGRTEVKVEISKRNLRHLLQFWYSGQSDLARRMSLLVRQRSDITYDTLLELVQLMAAADILCELELCEWLGQIVEEIVQNFPSTACVILQLHDECFASGQDFVDLILSKISENPHECFGVLECFAKGVHVADDSEKHIARKGLLMFSAETLEEVLSLPFAPKYQEYLFRVLYYWATNGEQLSAGAAPTDDAIQQCVDELAERVGDTLQLQSRYAKAKKIVSHLSLRDMSVFFLLEYVQSTELVEDKQLFEAMKYRLNRDSLLRQSN